MVRCCLWLLLFPVALPAQDVEVLKEKLTAFNDLVGSWKATGTPTGSLAEKQKGFWIETQTWQWQFKGNDAWLKVEFKDGKHFRQGTLRFLPSKNLYQLSLETLTKETQTFEGTLQNKVLILERSTPEAEQKLTFTFLHSNRFLSRFEVKGKDRPLFARVYDVGATKEGIPFVAGTGQKECIVSGGLGTSTVTYQGETYYVCCSGCRTEFNENPEKYVQAFKMKK